MAWSKGGGYLLKSIDGTPIPRKINEGGIIGMSLWLGTGQGNTMVVKTRDEDSWFDRLE